MLSAMIPRLPRLHEEEMPPGVGGGPGEGSSYFLVPTSRPGIDYLKTPQQQGLHVVSPLRPPSVDPA